MRSSLYLLLVVGWAVWAPTGLAQEPPAANPPAPTGEPVVEDSSREGLLPQLDVYLPEGDLDLRVNRLVKKVFVEGQVKYNFVEGDIAAFLRYKYYAYNRTHLISVFDEVEFPNVERRSNEFARVRGALLLTTWPHSYQRRTFLLAELDRISNSREEFVFNNDSTNTFVRLGYQIGTPQDARSNALVGDGRAAVQSLFTAFREIGPRDAGLTAALTWSFDQLGADYSYLKLELSGLKRFELPRNAFVVGRLRGGTFLDKETVRTGPEIPILDQFSIPRAEYFRLDGRENLKGVKERLRGTEQVQTTWELMIPWFLDTHHERLRLDWNNWYWVIYGGYGTTGFDREVYTDFGDYIVDVGLGFEASFHFRKYEFFLSGVVAQALDQDGGPKARLSIKSYH